MKLTLVIPCFNESASLPSLIHRCKALVGSGSVKIIFVDNGSTDNSMEIFEKTVSDNLNINIVRVEKI